MKRIAQIIPYFGKWPEWMPLYLYSCSRNQMIDFIFYTDCEFLPEYFNNEYRQNLIYHKCSFEEYTRLVSDRLGIDYNPVNAYKLTDLKPFLGLIHADILSDYDWWGFGDIDLVYGDMSKLINERNMKRYSLLTTHNYHIAGHCTFMRNNDYYRNLCLKIKDWERRLSDDRHYGFDEAEWSNLIYHNIKYPLTLHRRIIKHLLPKSFNRFMDLSNRIINPGQLFKEFHTSPAPNNNNYWGYDPIKGILTSSSGRELPYLHFLFFKKTHWFETSVYWRDGYYKLDNNRLSEYNKIIIDANGIHGN